MLRRFAQQRLRNGAREFDFADALFAMYQHRVWQARTPREEIIQRLTVPRQQINHGTSATSRSLNSARISSNVRAESMTLMRAGNSEARFR